MIKLQSKCYGGMKGQTPKSKDDYTTDNAYYFFREVITFRLQTFDALKFVSKICIKIMLKGPGIVCIA